LLKIVPVPPYFIANAAQLFAPIMARELGKDVFTDIADMELKSVFGESL